MKNKLNTEGVKYTGSKKGILPKILEITEKLEKTKNYIKSILDGFSGTTRVSQMYEKNGYDVDDEKIWGATYFSGLIEQLDTDSVDTDVIDVTATASITADSVIGELGKVYGKIPAAIENDPDLVWVVSSDIAKAYKQAQATQISTGNIVGDKVLDYLGHEMIRIDELPVKRMVVYRKSNLGDSYSLGSEIVYYS